MSVVDKRVFRFKDPVLEFYCPLCRSKRYLMYRSKLSKKNYLQLLILSIILAFGTYPWMGERSFVWPLVVWGGAELVLKIFFRKNIPCPYCGFDATWYKKDVRVAKRLVAEFWKKKMPVEKNVDASEGANLSATRSAARPAADGSVDSSVR
ncbi:MAG: hypothetical protein HQK53_01920 [Oligoflexia bacterium]|nr:hypothetical protein [Oligoflexia bacterium]